MSAGGARETGPEEEEGRGGRNRQAPNIYRQAEYRTERLLFCFTAICKLRNPPIHTNNPSGKLPSMTVREIVQMACAVAAPSNTPLRLFSLVVSGSYSATPSTLLRDTTMYCVRYIALAQYGGISSHPSG